jgi:hypothetical protein
MTLIERLRELSCSDKLTQGELETVVQALARIEFLQKELRDQEREFQREARDIAAEAAWAVRAERDGDPYGTY